MFTGDCRYTMYPVNLVKLLLWKTRLVETHLEDSTAQRILDETGNFILSDAGEFIYDDP